MRPFAHLSRRHVVPLAAFIGSAALAGAGLTLATSDGGGGDTLPPLPTAAESAAARGSDDFVERSGDQHLRFHDRQRHCSDVLVERAGHCHAPDRARIEHVGHRHDADGPRIEHVGHRHDAR